MSSPQHEPTMEEILASIRKIISEDTADTQSAPPAPAAPVETKVAQDVDVLELTEEVREEPRPAPVFAAATVPTEPPPPVSNDVVFQHIEEPPVSAQTNVPSSEGIFSDRTRKALNDAFTNLEPEPAEARPTAGPAAPVAPLDGRTLESVFDQAVRSTFDPVLHGWLEANKDAVVERMKPMVTQWLDEHFPAMLEEAVREELARVSKSRVRR